MKKLILMGTMISIQILQEILGPWELQLLAYSIHKDFICTISCSQGNKLRGLSYPFTKSANSRSILFQIDPRFLLWSRAERWRWEGIHGIVGMQKTPFKTQIQKLKPPAGYQVNAENQQSDCKKGFCNIFSVLLHTKIPQQMLARLPVIFNRGRSRLSQYQLWYARSAIHDVPIHSLLLPFWRSIKYHVTLYLNTYNELLTLYHITYSELQ